MTTVRRPGHDDLWREHGACAVSLTDDGRPRLLWLLGLFAVVDTSWPSELWFPEKGGGALAVRICAGCPVRFDCLDYAVTTREEYGIWGAAGELTRRRLARTLAGRTVTLQLLGLVGEISVRQHRRIYLIEVQDHFDRLDEAVATSRMPEGQAITYGPGATHGKKSTYKRGCRGDACRVAMGLRPRGIPCPTDSEEITG